MVCSETDPVAATSAGYVQPAASQVSEPAKNLAGSPRSAPRYMTR